MSAYAKFYALILPSLFMTVVGRIVAPIVVPFASEDGWLPSWLNWFQTPDNSIDGDNGWKTEHWQWRFKFSPPVARYLGRVGWLWRNSMYNWSINVLGAKLKATDTMFTEGDPLTSDNPAHSGTFKRRVYRDGKLIYWQWYFIYVYSKTRCIRMNFGWKLWGFDGTDKNVQYVLNPNFLKSARNAK